MAPTSKTQNQQRNQVLRTDNSRLALKFAGQLSMLPTSSRTAFFVALAWLSSFTPTPASPPERSAPAMPQQIEHHSADRQALQRKYRIKLAPAHRQRLAAFYEAELAQLNNQPFASLDQDGKVDYLLLKNQLHHEKRQLQHLEPKLQEISDLIPFRHLILQLEQSRLELDPVQPKESAKSLTECTSLIRSLQDTLASQKMDTDQPALNPVKANRAAQAVDELQQVLSAWHRFYAGYDPLFTWWASTSYEETDQALKDYSRFLRHEFAGYEEGKNDPIIGEPIGREALLDALQHEMIPYSPEELVEIANREFAWCEREYRRAARDLGFGDDWRAALDYVAEKHVPPGHQPALIKELAQEAVDFLEAGDLITIPELSKEVWRMHMMSPERQKVNPYFTGGEVISVSYPAAGMNFEEKLMSMRGNNVHMSRATVHHELIPGHHLQLFMAERYRPYRQAFRTPFFVEGWALYWEMYLWDLDFPQTPEDRIGMLFWRSHRCARIIFSLNFHLGKMSPQEAIDFLVERVGHERRNATGEVRRSVAGGYPPLYQAAYMLGGLQLRALHRELVGAGRMTDREFHDAVLQENAIPIELMRAKLLNTPLTKDYKTHWRFAGPIQAKQTDQESTAADRTQAPPKETAETDQPPKVYRDRIDPHWFRDNSRFWYRNNLPNDQREFIVVIPEGPGRQPAFDHARVADNLSGLIGRKIHPRRLPVESLLFTTNDHEVILQGPETSWSLNLDTYELAELQEDHPTSGSLPVSLEPRPSTRTGPETEITFVNHLDHPVELFWIDAGNQRRSYGRISQGEQRRQHTYAGHSWLVLGPDEQTVAVFEAKETPATAIIDGRKPDQVHNRPQPRESRQEPQAADVSPDGRWRALVRDHNLFLVDLQNQHEQQLTTTATRSNSYARDPQRARSVELKSASESPVSTRPEVIWSPNSEWLIAIRHQPGDERDVYLIESAPKDQLQPKLHSYPYLKPGDKLPVRKPHLFHAPTGRQFQLDDSLYSNPWSIQNLRWKEDSSRFTFIYNQRGHQVLRLIEVSIPTDQPLPNSDSEPQPAPSIRPLIDEQAETFICYSSKFFCRILDDSNEVIWMSERDGWNHLYLFDSRSGSLKSQITQGPWVVRAVDRVDVDNRQIWFRAGGIRPDQDPYHVHYARVDFDGSNLVILTEGDGTHALQFSPDNRFFIDTWSRVDLPPVSELRQSDNGFLICKLEEADAGELIASGRRFPERFVAPGRDGETPIYGIIHRPAGFDPARRYPVVEQIYAGPHGAFVPKSFRAAYQPQQSLADEGFVVVQIDGMGTSHRSKAFHDISWQNLADSGFPDRISWMKHAAEQHPEMDIGRVGIYGGSAGGQNALRALLDHGDFYKAAAADCGCHDNRMDKIWWNEQWLGWPVGPHYEASSNVAHAHKLQGKLLLTVGELDRNVDPASTMQVVDALIKADKEFELIVFPGAGHGAGGSSYGRQRRLDFFKRHLSQ